MAAPADIVTEAVALFNEQAEEDEFARWRAETQPDV